MARLKEVLKREKALAIPKNLSAQEFSYDKSSFSVKEKATDMAKSIALVLFFSFFFYKSLWAIGILAPIGWLYYQKTMKEREKKRKEKLAQQFQECLQAIMTNLRAGYSVENAFLESKKEMKLLFGDSGFIVKELQLIEQGLRNNKPLETLLISLGERSQIRAIAEFGELFVIAKRGGGNMIEIISNTAALIQEKMEVDRQIQVMLSAKKLEQKIMEVVPFMIVCYISVTSKGFFDVLYHNPLGIFIMSFCLVIYLISYLMAEKIMDIQFT